MTEESAGQQVEIPLSRLEMKTELIIGDNRIVYHVGKELPESGSNFLMVSGKARGQGVGVYCADRPDIRYSGSEAFRQKIERTPIYCIPLHGKWRRGKSELGYSTFNTAERAILMQDIKFFDIDILHAELQGRVYARDNISPQQIQKLRFYYSLHPVFFDEPDKFWKGNFAEAYREGKVSFEDVIPDLMRDEGKYEDRMDEEVVRTQLEIAVQDGIIPSNQELLNYLHSTPVDSRIWIGPQEKISRHNFTPLNTR